MGYRGYCRGILYIVLWFASIFAGYAGIFCPLLPLMFVSNKLYRRITDFIMTFWQMYPAALLEFIHGCQIHVTGDAVSADENTLMIMNHRTRTDWTFLWPAVYQATCGHNRWMYPTKFILKDPIRHLPGVGWMMQLGSYVYIKRNWEADKVKMSKVIDFFGELSCKFSLLIFPEGTDLTEHTKSNSDRFADKFNLPRYEHVLHPRTTGFCYLAKKMLQCGTLDAIYDVTIVYVDRVPQSEKSLIDGTLPRQICVHFKRYEPPDFGMSDASLASFLVRRWEEKELFLADFHQSQRALLYPENMSLRLRPDRKDLVVALVFWTLLPLPVAYLLATSPTFRCAVFLHTLFLLFVNYVSDGFQSFEIGVHEARKWFIEVIFQQHRSRMSNSRTY